MEQKMNLRPVFIWALGMAFSTGIASADVDMSERYSDTSAEALTNCVGSATSAEDVMACAEPYFGGCLEFLDDDLFSDCRRTALSWWADRVEEARAIDPVRTKTIAIEAERMRCGDTFTLMGDYMCEEKKRALVYFTVMFEQL